MSLNNLTNFVPSAEMVEGPYYGVGSPKRSDIRGNVEGKPFNLTIKVIDANSGNALKGITVDLWHCDATGHYPGYTFNPDKQPENVDYQMPDSPDNALRGAQETDADGVVKFTTIFPGWYATRAPHIHVKVFDESKCILTTQFFFPRSSTESIYTNDPHYQRSVIQDTYNESDTVLAFTPEAIDSCWIDFVSVDADELQGEAILVVDKNAHSVRHPIPEGFLPPVGGTPHDKNVR